MEIKDNILYNVKDEDIQNGTFIIPNSVTSIGDFAFYKCTSLTSITIPNSVTSIGEGAFYGCSGLTSVTIGNGVMSIGYAAFSGCSSLTSITIPDSVTSIGQSAFSGCSGLQSVTIGNSVTSIGSYAFDNCSSLTSVTIGNSVTSIGEDAFYGCYKLVEVWNKSSLTITAGSSSNGYVGYYALNVYKEEGGSKLTTDENGFVIYDGTTLVGYVGTATDITIPDTIQIINKGAFSGCSGLTSITIPDSVTSIGWYAFENRSGLQSVEIGNGVTSIGYEAFLGCNNLVYNEYDNAYYLGNETNPYVVLMKAKNTSITSCKINENTKVICYSAFEDCSGLISISIPDSVVSIGGNAFHNCSGLTSKKSIYKAFDLTKSGKLRCLDKIYTPDKWHSVKGDLRLCEKGIHYCTNLFEIFNYYSGELDKTVAIYGCEVKGEDLSGSYGSKHCCRWLKPVKRLSREYIISILNNKEIKDEQS